MSANSFQEAIHSDSSSVHQSRDSLVASYVRFTHCLEHGRATESQSTMICTIQPDSEQYIQ